MVCVNSSHQLTSGQHIPSVVKMGITEFQAGFNETTYLQYFHTWIWKQCFLLQQWLLWQVLVAYWSKNLCYKQYQNKQLKKSEKPRSNENGKTNDEAAFLLFFLLQCMLLYWKKTMCRFKNKEIKRILWNIISCHLF